MVSWPRIIAGTPVLAFSSRRHQPLNESSALTWQTQPMTIAVASHTLIPVRIALLVLNRCTNCRLQSSEFRFIAEF